MLILAPEQSTVLERAMTGPVRIIPAALRDGTFALPAQMLEDPRFEAIGGQLRALPQRLVSLSELVHESAALMFGDYDSEA